MDFKIRKFENKDKTEIISMMNKFYSSDAVYTNGSSEIFSNNFNVCISNSPYLTGYVFEFENKIMGYSMIVNSFSTEFSKKCIWFEDLFIKKEYRGNGIIPKFIEYVKSNNKDCIFRLEVEDYNKHAIHVYKKQGFKELPYKEMINLD